MNEKQKPVVVDSYINIGIHMIGTGPAGIGEVSVLLQRTIDVSAGMVVACGDTVYRVDNVFIAFDLGDGYRQYGGYISRMARQGDPREKWDGILEAS